MKRPLFRMVLAVAMIVLAACGGVSAAPPATALVTQVPATAAPAAPAVATATITSTMPAATLMPEALSAGPLHDVPRSRTLVLSWGTDSPVGVTNPWAVPGYTHQEGNNLLWDEHPIGALQRRARAPRHQPGDRP
jgi:hypothetical protein